MTGRIAKRLAELGITLPKPPAPVASYVPTVITGNLIFVSGQVCTDKDGKFITGKVGKDSRPRAGEGGGALLRQSTPSPSFKPPSATSTA